MQIYETGVEGLPTHYICSYEKPKLGDYAINIHAPLQNTVKKVEKCSPDNDTLGFRQYGWFKWCPLAECHGKVYFINNPNLFRPMIKTTTTKKTLVQLLLAEGTTRGEILKNHIEFFELDELNKIISTEYCPSLDESIWSLISYEMNTQGGKWTSKVQGWVFKENPSHIYNSFLKGVIPDTKRKTLQQYYTPKELSRKMVELAAIDDTCRVLEPSAGEGSILDMITEKCYDWVAVEIDPVNIEYLHKVYGENRKDAIIRKDFLKYNSDIYFDRVVMNPPFSNTQDIDHIIHAYSLIKNGGRLVSLSWDYTDKKIVKADMFKNFLKKTKAQIVKVDKKFKFEHTSIQPWLIVIDKT